MKAAALGYGKKKPDLKIFMSLISPKSTQSKDL